MPLRSDLKRIMPQVLAETSPVLLEQPYPLSPAVQMKRPQSRVPLFPDGSTLLEKKEPQAESVTTQVPRTTVTKRQVSSGIKGVIKEIPTSPIEADSLREYTVEVLKSLAKMLGISPLPLRKEKLVNTLTLNIVKLNEMLSSR